MGCGEREEMKVKTISVECNIKRDFVRMRCVSSGCIHSENAFIFGLPRSTEREGLRKEHNRKKWTFGNHSYS